MIANPIPYKIVSERLTIRCYEPQDLIALNDKSNRNREHLLPWLQWAIDAPFSIDSSIDTLRRLRANYDTDKDYTLGIFDLHSGELLGGTGLHMISKREYHIGYWIDLAHRGKGIITEAVKALTQVGLLYLHLDFVQIHHASKNSSSGNIPKKLGFHLDATLRDRIVIDETNIQDRVIWSMSRQEYQQNKMMFLPIECFDFAGRLIYSSTASE